jgi:hypothetical protein
MSGTRKYKMVVLPGLLLPGTLRNSRVPPQSKKARSPDYGHRGIPLPG